MNDAEQNPRTGRKEDVISLTKSVISPQTVLTVLISAVSVLGFFISMYVTFNDRTNDNSRRIEVVSVDVKRLDDNQKQSQRDVRDDLRIIQDKLSDLNMLIVSANTQAKQRTKEWTK